MRSACETRSTAAETSSRSILRAVSTRFAWSAASAPSNSVWSIGKSGGPAMSLTEEPLSRARRYSSRAADCSSGKPSKPSACAKRTTVELEVFARRASSSAVWKAASSRWSTMYWPTSFCERENSSKRWRISSESVSAVVPVRVTAPVFAGGREVPSGPHPPGGSVLGPEVVQEHRVLVGVHAVPEAEMAVGAELAAGRQALERLALEHRFRADVVERAGLEAEEAAVDPAVVAGLLGEAAHVAVAVQLGHAELQLGLDHRHRGEKAVTRVEAHEVAQIDVGHAVGVGRAEALAAESVRHAGDAPAGR